MVRIKSFVQQPISRLCVLILLAAALTACGGARREASAAGGDPPAAGSEVFERLDCIHCHAMDGSGPGPSLAGLYGKTVPLENGESVPVDEQYIRTSILDPRAQTHAGYPPIMPPYAGRIDEDELSALVEYIRSLAE
jgi:cytochrome c oxidase subunit 2